MGLSNHLIIRFSMIINYFSITIAFHACCLSCSKARFNFASAFCISAHFLNKFYFQRHDILKIVQLFSLPLRSFGLVFHVLKTFFSSFSKSGIFSQTGNILSFNFVFITNAYELFFLSAVSSICLTNVFFR